MKANTITLLECPECGRNDRHGSLGARKHYARGTLCPGVPVERVYVALDVVHAASARAEMLTDEWAEEMSFTQRVAVEWATERMAQRLAEALREATS